MVDFRLKQGDSLVAHCIYKDANGDPVNLLTAGIGIVSAVRSADGLTVYPLQVTIKDQNVTPGGYVVEGNSDSWAPGSPLMWDIRYQQDGHSFSSRTLHFSLLERVS